ncbi:sigma-70 family RNA polymerase sigma factor [Microlunatus flavus]|uniref:sigma-70 family RNA polymerase sigma factor n=1 Tax=Microlunatus flavus TaxID=1036181 RepID=UPI00147C7328|nr:sigma-70 family RNA polymerase sigma factor [Microlunatus flavus]
MERDLAGEFEAERPRLVAVAQRLLGSRADAEDAVQETWVRLQRSRTGSQERSGDGADPAAVTNLGGWLTTVTSRVCLDVLRARRARPELVHDEAVHPVVAAEPGPEAYAEAADAVGTALLVVLDALGPAERLAFVLHDVFALPFDEIGPVIDRSPTAARQLASRARRRVQGAPAADPPTRGRRREVVDAFLAASKEGRFADLLAVLDPDAVVRSDAAAASMGSVARIDGAEAVARFYDGRARALAPALVDGLPGAVWRHRGEVKVVVVFDVALGDTQGDDRVREVLLVADPERIARAEVTRRPGLTVVWWRDPEE